LAGLAEINKEAKGNGTHAANLDETQKKLPFGSFLILKLTSGN
jgi:hypothetical protein